MQMFSSHKAGGCEVVRAHAGISCACINEEHEGIQEPDAAAVTGREKLL